MQYQVGTNSLSVFVDGVNQYGPGAQYAYVETDDNTVTFVSGLHVGASVKFTTSQLNSSGAADASQVTYDPPFTGSVATNVEAKLAQTVSVKDFGAVGDGVTDDTSAIQDALDALTAGQTLIFDKNYKITSSLTITNKSRVRLTGKGKVFLSGAASGAYIFQLVGAIDDLEIDHLTLEGDNDDTLFQTGIGNASGQTISNVRFHDLNISNINVGISLNASASGTYEKGHVYANTLINILGTSSGQGYGIQTANAFNVVIEGNSVDNAERHAIYFSKGINANSVIANNVIANHRANISSPSYRCAMVVSRCSNVTVIGNKFANGKDGALEISHDPSTPSGCANILITGNTFSKKQNAAAYILIGLQTIETTYRTENVTIVGNTFENDVDVSNGALMIYIPNGRIIKISENTFINYYNGTTPSTEYIALGDETYLSADNQLTKIDIENNRVVADAVIAGAKGFVAVTDRLCTGTAPYTIKNNSLESVEDEVYFNIAPTNLKSKFKLKLDSTYNFGSIAANSIGSYQETFVGAKPTSQITVAPEYDANVIGRIMFSSFADTSAVNKVYVQAANVTASAYDPPSMTFKIYLEDF
jgi:hypothetical protein